MNTQKQPVSQTNPSQPKIELASYNDLRVGACLAASAAIVGFAVPFAPLVAEFALRFVLAVHSPNPDVPFEFRSTSLDFLADFAPIGISVLLLAYQQALMVVANARFYRAADRPMQMFALITSGSLAGVILCGLWLALTYVESEPVTVIIVVAAFLLALSVQAAMSGFVASKATALKKPKLRSRALEHSWLVNTVVALLAGLYGALWIIDFGPDGLGAETGVLIAVVLIVLYCVGGIMFLTLMIRVNRIVRREFSPPPPPPDSLPMPYPTAGPWITE